jgi:hypothetical protein
MSNSLSVASPEIPDCETAWEEIRSTRLKS